MGWTQTAGLWDFTLLSEPQLSSELARLSGAKSVGDSDIVCFQPCPNPEESSQDRYMINDWALSNGTWTFRALFDGHAGHEVVDYTSDKLPGLIHSALQDLLNKENAPSPDSVAEVLRNTISRFDESIGQALRDLFPDESVLANMTDAQIRNIINDGGPNYTTVRRCTRGTTVLVALVDPSKSNLWVASLGDCVAILGSKKADQWTATVMSTAHNGEAKEEAKRVIREHPNEPDVMLDNRVLGSIAVTRAVGDFAFKLPAMYTKRVFTNLEPGYDPAMRAKVEKFIDRNLTPPYMSGVPDVKHVNLRAGGVTESFIILCTDGLVDLHDERLEVDTVLSKRWIEFLGPQLVDKENNLALNILREGLGGTNDELVSRMITVEMTERWMDDTTIIVQRLF
ncbi:protein serine/threonine phosphatase 2C [Panaeolus papilionaceus]|nr:protein serine/threonine phosphatase 2C [Panaeolus papilionaceus]